MRAASSYVSDPRMVHDCNRPCCYSEQNLEENDSIDKVLLTGGPPQLDISLAAFVRLSRQGLVVPRHAFVH